MKILLHQMDMKNAYYPEYRVTDSFNIETQLFAGFELMMQLDIISYLPNDILTKVDRASMRCSLETRTPYLNHHLYELVCGLPKEFKINNGTTKHILRSINKKLIPIDLIDQPKQVLESRLENG